MRVWTVGRGPLLLGIVVALLSIQAAFRGIDDGLRRTPIRIEREGSKVRLWNNGGYDKVVTHLVFRFNEATLSPPVLLRNHLGETRIDLGGLVWHDVDGKPVPAPSPQDEVGAAVVDADVQMR